MSDKMSPYESVFNNHVNNAHERAMEVIREQFSKNLITEVEALYDNGIMLIFDDSPTIATMLYVALVTAFVNDY